MKKTTAIIVAIMVAFVPMMNVEAASKPAKGKITKVKVINAGIRDMPKYYVKLKWKKVAKKHQLYIKAPKKKYKRVTTKSRSIKLQMTKKGTYRFKVRGVNGKKKGKFSKVVKAYCPKASTSNAKQYKSKTTKATNSFAFNSGGFKEVKKGTYFVSHKGYESMKEDAKPTRGQFIKIGKTKFEDGKLTTKYRAFYSEKKRMLGIKTGSLMTYIPVKEMYSKEQIRVLYKIFPEGSISYKYVGLWNGNLIKEGTETFEELFEDYSALGMIKDNEYGTHYGKDGSKYYKVGDNNGDYIMYFKLGTFADWEKYNVRKKFTDNDSF